MIVAALNESQSGFKHTRHNPFMDLLFYYIIPNGAWLVFSAWMTYVFGVEILEGLAVAAGEDVDGNRVLSLKDE
ncbi:MAG: hypothetical protein LQ340_008103 [Diploschistes diacapsis]|nr:MAG: hypothetical protein LQ340_008103 [Diploschistes diacapsis]